MTPKRLLALPLLLAMTSCATTPPPAAPRSLASPPSPALPKWSELVRPPLPGLPQPPDVCPAWPVPTGSNPTAPLSFTFANHLSKEFIVRRVILAYDGADVCQRTSPAGIPLDAGLVAVSGPATAGEHRVEVFVNLDGNAAFSLRGYRFELISLHKLTVTPGKRLELSIVAYPKDPPTPLEERPALQYIDSGAGETDAGSPTNSSRRSSPGERP